MAGSAGGFHFGLHGSGRKRFAWGAGRLRARKNDGCEQKDYRKNSLEQAGSLSRFSILNSQFSILNSQFSILNSQFSILNSQFSILNSQFSILNSQFSI